MSVIEVKKITKDYGNYKGVFDVSFNVEKGEVLGFLGPNGSGKTTTIRQLMGFIKPDQGSVSIQSMDCFSQVDQVQNIVGYLPGEIAFMDEMSGMDFIRFIGKMKNVNDFSKAEQLIQFLEFDPKGKIKKMSKGMKQKVAIIIAFMNDPDILILDEPTSGLDPLMQNKFVDLIHEEKKKGKTILMSSHIFEEVEHTCDRVAIIKEGKIVAIERMEDLRVGKRKIYTIQFQCEQDAQSFLKQYPDAEIREKQVTLYLIGQVNKLLKELSNFSIEDISIRSQSLEELFLHFYGGEK